MASAIPGARFECVTAASHMSQFTDPSTLAARLISAVDGNPSGGRPA